MDKMVQQTSPFFSSFFRQSSHLSLEEFNQSRYREGGRIAIFFYDFI